ncbi:hypothetical protein QBC38DRAFT_480210 [Podospora fimiseda]|uniref:Uncharacterized protein n=1 Tax=Podospora fimiseda TaxID=252190 RepID=A0AAN7BP98_9PEZI|nr:hypothetical protein QBC38DRAFT_480210 [Podospora fimiseda]
MSLTAASTLSHRAHFVRVASVNGNQQTRNYWSLRDPSGYFRNAYRRYPSLRPRCEEILKQGLSSEKEPAAEESKSYFRNVSFSYWRTSPRQDFDGDFRTPDNPTGVRPEQNIEDAERAPLEGLLFGSKSDPTPKWRSKHERRVSEKAAKSKQLETEVEYVYDPVTNRKVPRPSVGDTLAQIAQAQAFIKSYRSQFSSLNPPVLDDKQAPIFYDGPPPPSELEKYAQVKIDSHPWETDTQPVEKVVPASSSSTPSAPEVVNALESMQKETLGYQNDIITSGVDRNAVSSQATTELGNNEAPYKAFQSHEPDGLYKNASEQGPPEELGKYNAVRSHEPDGKYKTVEESSPEELSKYNAVRTHEPDGKYKATETENPPEELSKYTAVRSHEPDGKYAVPYTDPFPDTAEVDHYSKPYLSHEPDGKYAASNNAPPKDDPELARYQPFRSHEPDGKYAAEMVAESEKEEMDQYQGGFRSHEPDGKYAAELEQVTEESDLGNHEAYNAEDTKVLTMPSEVTPAQIYAELQTYKVVGHDEPVERNPAAQWNKDPALSDLLQKSVTENKSEYRKLVETLMARQAREEETRNAGSGSSNAASNGNGSAAGKPSRRRRLTGQYAQDFPEDFAVAWSTETSETKSSLLPTDLSVCSATEVPKPGQPIPAHGVKPALERQSDNASAPTKSTSRETSSEPQPTMLYKILVYDPLMQAVEVAETTSMVPDSASPLTPAEALLRISNPARFFPHFAPLQAEGFEIVSGGGDVLIFRKVRDPIESVKPAETVSSVKEPPVNPIDMTGGSPYNVAAGRFASPTGFVNYELPPEGTCSKARERASGAMTAEEKMRNEKLEEIVVRAINRKIEGEEKAKNKKSGVGRRVALGAFSLAGFIYALGLAGDSFKQGRLEVKGTIPKA